MGLITYNAVQGSALWFEFRRAVITGSRFKDCRERMKNGEPSKKCTGYAMDVARERLGGSAYDKFATATMRIGTEQEPYARAAYEARTKRFVEEAGFITTADRLFGVSVDGLVDDDGIIEIKTMVSSATLFDVVVDGDISDYIDQCNGAMWLLGRQWVDLVLWAPDLEPIGRHLTIRRIERDDNAIEALERDLIEFERMVTQYENLLKKEVS